MKDINDPDFFTKERSPLDLEFYGPVDNRMARIRRVRHVWRRFGNINEGGEITEFYIDLD